MNAEVQNSVGAASEAAVVAQNNTNDRSFAEKAKKVAEKVAFGTIATACTVSAVACATYRVIRLIRLIKGDEK